jgi:hypothetical protein
MALRSPHRDWRLDLVNPVDVRAIGLDQLLTRLWLRVIHGNRPLLARANVAQQVSELAHEMERDSSGRFTGFADAPGAAETWLRADLVKTLRRSPDKFTVARPVHGLATRVRSVDKQSDDSMGSLAVYAWLENVDPNLIPELRAFVDVDADDDGLDLATFALALLGSSQPPDQERTDQPEPTPPPLCLAQAATYTQDVRRLLAYQDVMPRSALTEHLRRLTGFHLGLYLLRVFQVVVDVEQNRVLTCRTCATGTVGDRCPHRLELLVDCGEDARSPVARLAEDAWAHQEDSLAKYVRSHLALKKLYEFGEHLHRTQDRALPASLDQIVALENETDLLDLFFEDRISRMLDETASNDAKERMGELASEYRAQGMSSFRAYVALLAHYSEKRWFNYHRYLVDSLLVKNSADGLLRQPLGGRRRRRAAIGAALLETLTLIAVVDGTPGSYFTRPLRVDRLIEEFELRYDLLVARLPTEFADDLQATREIATNVDRFKARLRETGLYTDLSDAFLAQLVRPRHHIGLR